MISQSSGGNVRLWRLLEHLGPVAQATINVISIYSEAIRTGDLNPHELRVALLKLSDAATIAEGRVGEVIAERVAEWEAGR